MSLIDDLLRTTVCLGAQRGEQWRPIGCGFLFSDASMVWLVTTGTVLARAEGDVLTAWVPRGGEGILLGLSEVMQRAGLDWVRGDRGDVAACVFPVHPDWNVKAIPRTQALPAGKLSALMRVHYIAFPYGMEGFDPRSSLPILLPGGVAGVDTARARIHLAAPSLPLNEGMPLMLASGPDHQLQLILAGVMNGPLPTSVPVAPTSIPATVAGLSVATPIDVVVDLLSSPAAGEHRDKVSAAAARENR